jgi:hypothetical protein
MMAKVSSRIILITIGFVLATGIHAPLLSQNKVPESENLQIPALGKLIESALLNSPLLNEQDALIKIRELQLE